MFVSLITLFSALSLSSISAYYSVLGLMAIFSATPVPIAVMGGALEAAKIVTTVWLHYNWDRSPFRIKAYLVPAVVTLMFITSLGSFGFLSKGHADQAIPSGDIQAQVSLIDEKIKTQRDNIESSKKALVQMDGSVDQVLGRSTTENGAVKAAAMRKSQAKERAALQKDIDDSQKIITQLQEQRAPIAAQLRKVVADVGPLKYIAAVIYGDKADENLLESAVRWVIMIIVAVFDPLAIVLLLAATTSIDWSKLDRTKRKHDKIEEEIKAVDDNARLLAAKAASDAAADERTALLVNQAIETTRTQCELEFEKSRLSECDSCAEVSATQLDAATVQLEEKTEEHLQQSAALSGVMTHVTEMTDHVTDLTNVINSMEETVAASIDREESLKHDLATLVSEYDTLMSINSELNTRLSDAQTELQVLDEVTLHLAVAKEDISERDAEIVALHQKIADSKTRQEQVEVLLIEYEEEINTMREALEAMKNRHIVPVGTEPLGAEFDNVLHENIWDLYESEPEPEGSLEKPEPEVEEPGNDSPTAWILRNTGEPPVVEELPELAVITEPAVTNAVVLDHVEESESIVEQEPEPEEDVQLHEEIAQAEEPEVVVASEPTIGVVSRSVPDYSLAPDTTQRIPEKTVITLPEVPLQSALPKGGNAGFGVSFPPHPLKGDMFLRVDFIPSRLHKWSGDKWMVVDKSGVDVYSYDEEYIKLLIAKVSTGEYDAETDLTDPEREQIAVYLRTHSE